MTRPRTAPVPPGVLRYGVDGWPYIIGLGCAAVSLGAVAVAMVRDGRPGLRPVGAVTSVAAVAALVPTVLGLDYVVAGKLALRDRVVDMLPWRGDEIVLDIGSGAGLLAVAAAHRVPRGRVIAVDLWAAKDLSSNGPNRWRRNAAVEGVVDRVDIRTGCRRDSPGPAPGGERPS